VLFLHNAHWFTFQKKLEMKKHFTIAALLMAHCFVFAQNVGIGTITPRARLHVADSAVLFSATGDVPTTTTLSISGPGRRLLWHPGKAAFRVGYVDGTQWDNSYIGAYSFASGYNPIVTGWFSAACGESDTVSGFGSFAAGSSNNVYGDYSFAAGYGNSASSFAAVFGDGSHADGFSSISGGTNCTATGNGSAAIGYGVIAKPPGGFSVGAYNDNADVPSAYNFLPTDRLFQVGNGSSGNARSNAVTVLRNGRMGIGTVEPSAKLHIKLGTGAGSGLPYSDQFALENSSSAYFSFLVPDNIESGLIFGLNSNNVGGNIIYNNAGTPKGFQFRTRNNVARMVIDSLGRIGIGTVSPNVALTFPSITGDKISLWNDGGPTHYGMGVQNGMLQVFTRATTDDVAFGYGSSNSFTETMRIKGTGNVGIGTSSPSQRLQVIGNICATGTIGSCSDIRYKTNIAPLTNALTSIVMLHGISYDWNRQEFPEMEFTNKRQIGFSAQEVEDIFPEIVATDDNGYKSVDYGKLTPLLVEALKEQQKEITDLKSEVREMKKMIDTLSKGGSKNK
jgi:hypothetical protein